MRDAIYLSLYRVLKFIFTVTPAFLLDPFLNFIAFLFYKLDAKHTKIIRANLNFAYSDELSAAQKERIIKDVYKNYAKFTVNFIKNQNASKEKILEKVEFKDINILQNALATGRPVIVQTAHYGQWELFSLAMAAKFGGVSIVGRALDSEAMQRILAANRTRFDIELIDKMGGARQILKAIKARRLVGILVDQNTAKDEGVEIEFFGRKALHTPAVSIFAQKTDALIVPAFIREKGRNLSEIRFFPPIDIRNFAKEDAVIKATQAQADATEAVVRERPGEYFWFHKRFKHFNEEIYKC